MYQKNNHKTIGRQLLPTSLKITHHLWNVRYNGFQTFLIILLIFIIQVPTSCKKFVQIGTPPNRVTQQNVFSTDRSAATVLTGIYSDLSRWGDDISMYVGVLADEWTLWTGADLDRKAYYTNSLEATQARNTGKEIWNAYYNFIFRCNAAIEGLTDNNSLTPAVQKQLLGEAYFLRSWFYFYLVNLYGDLSLTVSTDPEINRLLPRSSVQAVYQLILDDLLKAQQLLSADYVNGQLMPYTTGVLERVRPTQWAATALLARIYLYTAQWAKAETESSKLITNTALFNLSSLPSAFLKNSREAIWQLQPVDAGWNTQEARMFHLSASPAGLSNNKPVHLSSFLLSAFEADDQRRVKWVDSLISGGSAYYFPAKYKVGVQIPTVTSPSALTEYCMVFRLGEQYLIRAEARARLNSLPNAVSDLDSLRKRAGLPLISVTNPTISQSALLETILHERQIELLAEWGNRWFDLKRFNKVDEVMSIVTPAKGGTWEHTDQLLPIPYNDLLFNPRLTQNAGY